MGVLCLVTWCVAWRSQIATLPEDGNAIPKHVGATTHNKLAFVDFSSIYINEMHGSRIKIPSKISGQAALRGEI
jgi:hypothetical protein